MPPPPKPNYLPAYLVGMGAVAALGVGTLFGIRAIASRNASEAEGLPCNPACKGYMDEAGTFADLSTGAFIVGGVLAVATAVLFLTAPKPRW
jgi:hypothetical protein